MLPKLVAEDIPLLRSLLSDVFPNVEYREDKMAALREKIKIVCEEMHPVYGESNETGAFWFACHEGLILPIAIFRSKANLHLAGGITLKRVTSGAVHLRFIAPGLLSSEATSQRWRAVGDTADLTNPESKPRPPAPIACT